MTTSTIYTIEREFGSGGHIVGEMLAKKLGIPFYDSQIVDMAAKSAGVSKKIFEGFDEKPTNSFLYSLVMGSFTSVGPMSQTPELNMSDKLFIEEAKIIREAAEQGPCVIVGRCADAILEGKADLLKVFIKFYEIFTLGTGQGHGIQVFLGSHILDPRHKVFDPVK